MKCDQIRDWLLTEFMDQENLSEDQPVLKRHLDECESCKHLTEELMSASARLFKEPGEMQPPPEIWTKIEARLQATGERTSRLPVEDWVLNLKRLFTLPRLSFLGPALAGVIVFISVFLVHPDGKEREAAAYLLEEFGMMPSGQDSAFEDESAELHTVIEDFFVF